MTNLRFTYQEMIARLDQVSHLIPSKNKSHEKDRIKAYFVKGTRVCLVATEIYTGNAFLRWELKKKNKNIFKSISFEEVLTNSFLSKKAKSELLFNIDLFS